MNKIGMIRSNWLLLLLSFIVISIISCRKLVETDPPSDSITESNVYSNDASAIAVLNNIYIMMSESGPGRPIQGTGSIALFAGLSADEFTLYNDVTSNIYLGYYKNTLIQTLGIPFSGSEHWAPLYNSIFKCNAAIGGLNETKTLTPTVKQQLIGEAKFLRGFFYFYLVNLFGDVPLVLSTNPQVNTLLARVSKIKVYEQIIADLTDAEEMLSDSYLNQTLLSKTTERIRPTKWAASAMLARVYLYMGDFVKSEAKSTLVINYSSLFGPLPELNNVFLKNSQEAIWQIQPTAINFNTSEAQTLVLSSPTAGPVNLSKPVYLSNDLLTSVEVNDLRAKPKNWIDTITVTGIKYYFPYKYKVNASPGIIDAGGMTEYFMVLRLAEQYLIRAEARAQQGNIAGTQSDLNAIRNRAGLTNTTANDQASLLTAILNERRHELFTEWGHRWLDLKRTGKVDEVMTIATSVKSNGATQWQSYQQLYPLPLTELQAAPNLVQNTGY
jgi:starch-binding outer membrane protein, SusD/RagB family